MPIRTTFLIIVLSTFGLAACSGCGAPNAKVIDGQVARALQKDSEDGAKVEEGNSENVSEPDAPDAPDAPDVRAFDHAAFDALLKTYVRYEDGRVDYAGLATEEAKLDAYIATLADADLESLSRDAQLALLINAYNAFTLKLILENYGEIESIKDLSDPWGTKRWKLAGDTLSLDNVEHGLIRPIFKDPRIHFAVNCAAIGCPPLANEAFIGTKLDAQLDAVSNDAMSNPRYVRVEGGKLHVTKILDWYGEDFTKDGWAPTDDSIAGWVAGYSTDDVASFVKKDAPKKVAFLDYDWSLNDVAK